MVEKDMWGVGMDLWLLEIQGIIYYLCGSYILRESLKG